MISGPIVKELTRIGFQPDPRSKYDYQIFNYGCWCVSFELENNGMWVWIENGGKIIRNYVTSQKSCRELVRKLENNFIKKNA